MNLYLISQTQNQTYDTYDSAVVAAESEEHARAIHPSGSDKIRANMKKDVWEEYTCDYYNPRNLKQAWRPMNRCCDGWTSKPSKVSVTLIGAAVEGTSAGVICASFNAG